MKYWKCWYKTFSFCGSLLLIFFTTTADIPHFLKPILSTQDILYLRLENVLFCFGWHEKEKETKWRAEAQNLFHWLIFF